MLGKLVVRIYKAEGLASADINGKSDPFIKMHLVNQFHRTSTQYKTLNPDWNEMFQFKIHDINNSLEFQVYDEDRHGEDFLGRFTVPLLSIKDKQVLWYQLKDKKLQNPVKGRVMVRMDLEWSITKACIRTFNPLEKLVDPPPPVIRKSLMVSNFMRAKTHIMVIVDLLKYIQSCFLWENKLRSLNAFILFFVITYNFELWMLPFMLLCILCFNLGIMKSPKVRDLLGFDESKYTSITDISYILAGDDSIDDISQLNKIQNIKEENNNSSQDPDDNKTIVERFQAGKDVIIMIQDITGAIASYLERIVHTFTFKVPFLSYLMMFCLLIATLLLYLVPLRYIILAWGINKFTRKLRNPNAIDNNELIDFLSRVPDSLESVKHKNTVSFEHVKL